MAAAKKKIAAIPGNRLVPFHDRISDEVTISRYNYEKAGQPRESMRGKFAAKERPPSGKPDDPVAAAVHVVVPGDAPQDYADLEFLIRHYEASLPHKETIAFVQITIRFPNEPNLHRPFEIVREWVRAEICGEGLPAAVILHNPALAGSSRTGHVHVMIWPRTVNRLGWGRMVRDLANDAGRKAIWMSWQDHLAAAN